MPRVLVTLCLATFTAAALGQVDGDEQLHCSNLFGARATGYPDAAETARLTERWLVTWYPTRARFEEARVIAIREKTGCIGQARARVAALEEERREFEGKLGIPRGRPLPLAVQAYIDAQAAKRVAAKEHEIQQETDLARMYEVYDAQLKRLQSRPDWR